MVLPSTGCYCFVYFGLTMILSLLDGKNEEGKTGPGGRIAIRSFWEVPWEILCTSNKYKCI